jgi:hypothetical protein
MIPVPKKYRRKSKARITAHLEFSDTGYLKCIYLNSETEEDQKILERALKRLFKPDHVLWIRRILRRI